MYNVLKYKKYKEMCSIIKGKCYKIKGWKVDMSKKQNLVEYRENQKWCKIIWKSVELLEIKRKMKYNKQKILWSKWLKRGNDKIAQFSGM